MIILSDRSNQHITELSVEICHYFESAIKILNFEVFMFKSIQSVYL